MGRPSRAFGLDTQSNDGAILVTQSLQKMACEKETVAAKKTLAA